MPAREAAVTDGERLDPRTSSSGSSTRDRRCPGAHPRLQRGGLPLDAAAARLAARAPRRVRGAATASRSRGARPATAAPDRRAASRPAPRSPRCRTRLLAGVPDDPAARRRGRAVALAARPAARLPPPREKPTWWEFFSRFERPRRSSRRATPRRSPASSEVGAPGALPAAVALADPHAALPGPGAQDRRGRLHRPVHRRRSTPTPASSTRSAHASSTSAACATARA